MVLIFILRTETYYIYIRTTNNNTTYLLT